MTVKVAEAPGASDAIVHLTVPGSKAMGVVQLKVGPLSWFSLTKTTSAGSGSFNATFAASEGPSLLTPIVEVIVPPGVTVSAEADLVMPTSAIAKTVVVAVEE